MGLTKKRATFGPLSRATVDAERFAPTNLSHRESLRYFSPGAIPPRRAAATIAPEFGRAARSHRRLSRRWSALQRNPATKPVNETLRPSQRAVPFTARRVRAYHAKNQRRQSRNAANALSGFSATRSPMAPSR